ncbi:MAG: tetratricopeptide repeat protein [Nonlabens sp.]
MKYLLLSLCLSIGLMGVSQKRELKKIDKALESREMAEALEIFNTIDENEVEEKYEGKYKFYKAAVTSGVVGQKKATYDEIKEAENLIEESKASGYANELIPIVEQAIQGRKLQIANELLNSGDSDKAVMIIDNIYKNNPENTDMLFTSAQLSYQNSDFDSAIRKFQELLDLGYTGQKTLFYAVNNETGKEESFPNQKIMSVSINRVKTHSNPREETTPSKLGAIVNNLVWLYKNDQQLDKAKFIFEKAQQRFPDDASLKLVKPDIFLNLGMTEAYKEAVAANENSVKDPKVYNNLGASAMKAKDYDGAIKYYESSLKLKEESFLAHVNLSNAYLEKGNLEGTTYEQQQEAYKTALSHLERAHEIKPDEKNIMPTMVSLYGVFEMTDKAEAIKAKM